MKNLITIVVLSLSCYTAFSQVGINNTNPNASLDITATSVATPSNTDGILIPRIDDFPLTQPTVAQDGMLVFLTGAGTPAEGVYYWDNGTTSWILVGGIGIEKIDDLSDGKSDDDGSNNGSSIFLGIDAGFNDDATDNKNIGIGFESLNANATGARNTAVGFQTLTVNTLGGQNTAIGNTALTNNTFGGHNTALGNISMSGNTTGDFNTAVGSGSLQSNTDGNQNAALGAYSLTSNSLGNRNAAIGYETMFYNTIGEHNTAVGGQALYENTSGSRNTAIGHQSLYENTIGTNNSAVGNQALNGNTTGTQNTAIGANAMLSNTDGGSNTAVGAASLDSNTTGIWNTGIGQSALSGNVDGSYNTAMGRASMLFNTSGNSNVALGVFALNSNASGSFNTVIGTEAATTMTTNSSNTVIGRRAMNSFTSGDSNVALGASAGYYGSGSQNTYLGATAGFSPGGPARTGSVFVGFGAGSAETTSNKLYIENSTSDSDNALIYGEFDTNILRTNGELQIGNPTGTGYSLPTADGTVGQVLTTDGAGQIAFSPAVVDTKNTLNGAYDEGGAGAGRIITADTGAVEVQGAGGVRVEGDIVAAENIIHDGDANTFLSFTDDRIEIDAGGRNYVNINHANQSVVFNEDSAESDFRVESGTENNMLFVDGSANTIGIGEANPDSPLHIGITTTFDLDHANTGQDGIFIEGGGASGLNAVGGSISFGPPSNTREDHRKAAIASVQTGGDIDFTGLAFYVHGNPVNQSPMVEGMRLTHNRQLGINNISPSANLDVIGTLQYEDGNEAAGFVLTSDASGNASWQSPAASSLSLARITMSAAQTDTGTAWSKVDFDTVDFDLNGDFNTTTDEFEAPTTGYYRIGASWRDTSQTTAVSYAIGIYVNGSRVRSEEYAHGPSGVLVRSINSIVSLNANDTVEIYYYHDNTIDIDASDHVSYFEIEQIR